MSPDFRERLVVIALSFTLYGIFILLCGASMYALVRKWLNNRKHPTGTLVLAVGLLSLFASTTINMITAFMGNSFLLFNSKSQYPCCGPTATLTLNILLGDAIVCWRACVLWRRNRIFMGICSMLLLSTFALGVVDTNYACKLGLTGSGTWQPDHHADGNGNLYEGFSYGVAATTLTLSTNLFATVAVVVKTWQTRRVLRRYVVQTGLAVSQMQQLFTLLVESGMVYCALWTTVLVWQAGKYLGVPSHRGDNSFWDIFNIVVNGALVPLIAIYPTVIIVVVALNRSHIDNGLSKPYQSGSHSHSVIHGIPVRRSLAIAVNTMVTTHCDEEIPVGPKGALVHDSDEDYERKDSMDSSSTRTIEERKYERALFDMP